MDSPHTHVMMNSTVSVNIHLHDSNQLILTDEKMSTLVISDHALNVSMEITVFFRRRSSFVVESIPVFVFNSHLEPDSS